MCRFFLNQFVIVKVNPANQGKVFCQIANELVKRLSAASDGLKPFLTKNKDAFFCRTSLLETALVMDIPLKENFQITLAVCADG